jgi:hypothetical protein
MVDGLVINLVGPPASGKSSFAARYALEHPEFKYCPIDEYRITYEDEAVAWGVFHEDIVNNPNIIIESCGLSYRLNNIFNSGSVRERPLVTIRIDVHQISVLRARLDNRRKRRVPLPIHLSMLAEMDTAKFFWENLDKMGPKIDHTVFTDLYSNPNEYYAQVVDFINKTIMEEPNKRAVREKIFNRAHGQFAQL